MTAPGWKHEELERIASANELHIAPLRGDGTSGRPVPIWVVEKDVELLGAEEREGDAVDRAYRDKYDRYPKYVEPMVSPQARATTLRLVPRVGDGEAG